MMAMLIGGSHDHEIVELSNLEPEIRMPVRTPPLMSAIQKHPASGPMPVEVYRRGEIVDKFGTKHPVYVLANDIDQRCAVQRLLDHYFGPASRASASTLGVSSVCDAIQSAQSMATVDVANILHALRLRLARTPLQQQGRSDVDKVLTVAHVAVVVLWVDDKS